MSLSEWLSLLGLQVRLAEEVKGGVVDEVYEVVGVLLNLREDPTANRDHPLISQLGAHRHPGVAEAFDKATALRGLLRE